MPEKKSHSGTARKIKVLLVDDHASMREGLAMVINHQPDLVVCGEASDANRALEAIVALEPDIAVVDISLEGRNGIELIKDIRVSHPKLPILVFSMHEESAYAERAVRAGAQGYLTKKESIHRVMDAVRRIVKGGLCFSEPVMERLALAAAHGKPRPAASPMDTLSDRELEVFQLIGQGRRTHEIARELNMSERTVEAHRLHLRQKLGLESATELLQYAIQWLRSKGS